MANKTVQFGRSSYVKEVEELAAIVAKVKQARGSVSARKQAALMEGLSVTISCDDRPPLFLDADGGTPLGELALWVKAVDAWAEQQADEIVTGILKKSTTDQATLDSLKAQYADKRQKVDAMAVMCATFEIDVTDIVIPAMAKTNSGSTTTRTVKTSGMHYYRIKDGNKVDQSDAQDSHSSFAFYHAKKAMGLDKDADRPGTEGFTTWLTTQDGFKSVTEAWEVTGADGNKYGMEILDK